ncbi:aspartate racemase [Aneurinibacillus migulanus]|uniref:Aspartate racemase n=1 Tax=Aneurinibacillus migulanus TaxID=47500 RepID=A0A1G8LD84_ANEMI|nr:aspartate racemase [Aneurinibacillus migulanus]
MTLKTVGLIGGMSWESSILYYKIMNELVQKKLGGLNSAKTIMYSVNFEEIVALQKEGKWEEAADVLIHTARQLEKAGADIIVICTNTMHKVAEQVEQAIEIPLLHIVDATVSQILASGLSKVGLLATKYTMEQEFYIKRFQKLGIDVFIPTEEEREVVHQVIFEELCKGKINSKSRESYKKIIKNLIQKGAEGIILGCTEITLLVKPEDSEVPLFDTTYIHAEEAVRYALQ